MAKYILTGGGGAFIQGRRVDVGEAFILADDVKPPKLSTKIEEGDAAPAPVEAIDDRKALSEMIAKKAAEVIENRTADVDPVP